VPAGKAAIVSHRGARITLAKVIELERAGEKARALLDGAKKALGGEAVSPEIESYAQRWLEKAGVLSADDWKAFCCDQTTQMRYCQHSVANANRTRISYAINIRSLRLLARKNCQALTRKDLREFRNELRLAVKRYQLDHASDPRDPRRPPDVVELTTLTVRRKQLTKVKTSAVHLCANPENGSWASRLAKALEAACGDNGTAFLLARALAHGPYGRLAELPMLVGELPMLVGELQAAAVRASVESCVFEYVSHVPPKDNDGEEVMPQLRKLIVRRREPLLTDVTAAGEPVEARRSPSNDNAARDAASRVLAFSMKWLPRVQVFANLDIDSLAPVGRSLPDPALAPLVACLVPLWERTTGYGRKICSVDERHRFGEWVAGIVKLAGFPPARDRDWSVWTVLELDKPEK
jgi:hypothetical protein